MLLMLLAACTGGPDNNETGLTTVDPSQVLVTDLGAIIEGEPSYTLSFAHMMGDQNAECSLAVEVTDCAGEVIDEIQLPRAMTGEWEVAEGLCLNVASGDKNFTVNGYDAIIHREEKVEFRSNWQALGPFVADVSIESELDWYLDGQKEYYCWAEERYWWTDEEWVQDSDDHIKLTSEPVTMFTESDGQINGPGSPFGGVYIVGDTLESRTENFSYHDTWQSEDGSSFGATEVFDQVYKDVIVCIDRSTL